MKQTPNYALNQWETTDRILMADFNADNTKLDAALKAEADARTEAAEALAAAVALRGNCQLWVTTYTGSGKAGSVENSLTFPKKPTLVLIIAPNGSFLPILYGAERCLAVVEGRTYPMQNGSNWDGNTVTWSNGSSYVDCQMNTADAVYTVIALLAADQ